MAITKIKEIRSTLDKAIKYICNPKKTEDGLLTYGYKCVPQTAAKMMEATARRGSGRGNRIAYHLIQSFSPEDHITPEKAFEIGQEYANQVTGGNYEYVLATHDDRDHIHNHIIFNATSFVTLKKYHHSKDDVIRIQEISDKLCEENKLSVITRTSGRKGKQYIEYKSQKVGQAWKTQLADLIDHAVLEADSLDDFIGKLEMEGVIVKVGKYISFKCEMIGQKRAVRGARIGSGYTREALKARIENDTDYLNENRLCREGGLKLVNTSSTDIEHEKRQTKQKEKKGNFEKPRINLLVKTAELEKAQKSKRYANAVERSNIANTVKSMKFLTEHGIETTDDLVTYEEADRAAVSLYKNLLDTKDNERKLLYKKISMVQDYRKNIGRYIEWRRNGSKASFRAEYKDEIDKYTSAAAYFKETGENQKKLNLSEMFSEYREIKAEVANLRSNYSEAKAKLKETVIVRKNYEMILDKELVEDVKVEKMQKRKKYYDLKDSL